MTTVQQTGISAVPEPADPAQNPPLPGTTVGGAVGTFSADFTLWNQDHTRSRTLNGQVDTGASYTLVPAAILEELGIARFETRIFTLADGSRREMSIGLVDLELEGRHRTVYVLFGDEKGQGGTGLDDSIRLCPGRRRQEPPADSRRIDLVAGKSAIAQENVMVDHSRYADPTDRPIAADDACPLPVQPGQDTATPPDWTWRRISASQPNAAVFHINHSDVTQVKVDALRPADSPPDAPFVITQDIPIIIIDSLDQYWAGESRTRLPLQGLRVPVAADTEQEAKAKLAADLAAQLRLLLLLSSSRQGEIAPELKANLRYLGSVLAAR